MNITLKCLIFGLDCGSLVSDNKHLCISMIAYSILVLGVSVHLEILTLKILI